MKLILFILTGLISTQAMSADLIYKQGFENTALVGGVVTGLTSTGLIIHLSSGANNETLSMDTNGTFIFNQNVTIGVNWVVTIQTQPSNPSVQTCELSNATGTMTSSGVDNIAVSCSDTPNNWDLMKWDEAAWQ